MQENNNEKAVLNLDGLPDEVRKAIEQDGQNYTKSKLALAPTIGISTDDDTLGTFFINYPEAEGGKKLLTKELDVVILKERKTYSYYNDKAKKLELFTNEIDMFNGFVPENHPVILKNEDGDVVFEGTHKDFQLAKKEMWMDKNHEGQYPKSLLKQKTLLYVYVPSEQKIARLFANFSSTVGVDPNGGYLFDKPEPQSLEHLKDLKTGIAPYTYMITVTNIKGGGSLPWRQLKFNYKADLPAQHVLKMFEMKRELDKYCETMAVMNGVDPSKVKPGSANVDKVEASTFKKVAGLAAGIPEAEANFADPGLPTIDYPEADSIGEPTQTEEEEFSIENIPF